MSETQTVIEATGISKVYWDGNSNLSVLKDISLSVPEGQGIAILGPSGSGKTTLLNILSGLDRPTQGRVKLAGVAIDSLNESRKAEFRNRHLGFVFQFYHLLGELTALENVLLPALIHRGRVDHPLVNKAKALLERVGLKQRFEHYPSELSGGEQQRVAMARALINDPKILFCDEPTGNLDAAMGQEVAGLVEDFFKDQKKTVVLVTHDAEIAKIADHVWNLANGQWER
jgi:ABC-type lipoprotein export system ATPase subunit